MTYESLSNTSPVLNFAWIGELNILHDLFGIITIPEAVACELRKNGVGQQIEKALPWLRTESCVDNPTVRTLLLELDPGEAEAITLGIETQTDLLLIDERKGRAIAGRLGLKVMGIAGILIYAKRKGVVSAVRPLLDKMVSEAGFWLSPRLQRQIIQEAGE